MVPRIFAVCIGINFYPNAKKNDTRSLDGCVNDCNSFISYLTDVLKVPNKQITRLTSTKHNTEYRATEDDERLPTYQNITQALINLSQECEKDDQVLIAYSGHGSRVWSIVPEWRGKKNKMDETLVPMDASRHSRVLRDFELSYLLGLIVAKECRLTVVLDSCHSGGAFRAPDARQQEEFHAMGLRARSTMLMNITQELNSKQEAARVAARMDYDERKPLGVSLQDLEVHWNTMQDRTENVPQHQWLVKPFGYEIWTGCLQHELNWEINGSGRLTSALMDSLLSSDPTTTSLGLLYRNVYDVVYGKHVYEEKVRKVMHREPILQTPLLLGDVHRGFLTVLTEGVTLKQVVGIPIHAVPFPVDFGVQFAPFEPRSPRSPQSLPALILRAGYAHGVQKGSEYAVYLWHDNLNSESQIRVVITQVGAVASIVRVVGSPDLSRFKEVSNDQHTRQSGRMEEYYNSFPPNHWRRSTRTKTPQDITYPWPSGCQAVLVAGPSANAKRVRLVATGGTPFPAPWDGANTKYVRAEVPLLVVPEDSTPAEEDGTAYFQVKSNDDQYEVHDGGSDVVLAKADSVKKALQNIVHISQYRTWLGLVGSRTPADRDNINLFTLEQTERAPVLDKDNIEKIKLKFKVDVEYIETYDQVHVNVALFHFSPHFGVRQIYPQEGQFETIDAGDQREISFEREIPAVGPGNDGVKAVVHQCSTGFKMWELPELGKEGEDGQPVRRSMDIVGNPAPVDLAGMDPVPARGNNAPVVDWEAKEYKRYWLLQKPITAV